jgi:hypothetical protein
VAAKEAGCNGNLEGAAVIIITDRSMGEHCTPPSSH